MLANRTFYIFLLLSIVCFQSAYAATAILKRKDTGTDICAPKKCLPLKPLSDRTEGDTGYETSFELIINLNTVDLTCAFPWTIKAVDADGKTVAESIEINELDFWEIQNSNGLGIAEVDLRITHKDIQDSPSLGCFRSTCNEPYTLIDITFKIYGEFGELTPNCPYFVHPDLVIGSNSYTENISLCLCIDNGGPVIIGGEETGGKPRTEERPLVEKSIGSKYKGKQFSNSLSEVHNVDIAEITLFPNPTSQELTLKISFLEELKNFLVPWQLFNLAGKKIKSGVYDRDLESQEILVSGELSEGTYIMKIHVLEAVLVRKIVILR